MHFVIVLRDSVYFDRVHFTPVPPFFSVRGCAREHSSIYIYMYIYIYMAMSILFCTKNVLYHGKARKGFEIGFCKEGWHDFPWRRPFRVLSVVVRKGCYVSSLEMSYNPIGRLERKIEMCGSAI